MTGETIRVIEYQALTALEKEVESLKQKLAVAVEALREIKLIVLDENHYKSTRVMTVIGETLKEYENS